MKLSKLFFYFEKVLFFPKGSDWILPILLLPASIIYCLITFINSSIKYLNRKEFGIPIIGVGNLILGGSGKTPLIIALAKKEKRKVAIVLRGYGRESRGLKVLSKENLNIKEYGDEAVLYFKKVPNSIVIVSENRVLAILKAKELGAETLFLDDAYRQHHIVKKEIVIESDIKNPFCLPAGGYREKLWFFKKDIILLKEGRDFLRKVSIENKSEKMVLITAISKPHRLYKFIPTNIPKYTFPDHHTFLESEIAEIVQKEKPSSILTTEKDFVKLEKFKFKFSILKLEIELIKKLL